MASTNSDNAINPGAVWVAGTPEDVSALDSAVGLMPSEIVPTVEYMQNQKLIAGDNVTISEFDNTINVATATATKAGVAALGVIPAGTDKTSTATIWIE